MILSKRIAWPALILAATSLTVACSSDENSGGSGGSGTGGSENGSGGSENGSGGNGSGGDGSGGAATGGAGGATGGAGGDNMGGMGGDASGSTVKAAVIYIDELTHEDADSPSGSTIISSFASDNEGWAFADDPANPAGTPVATWDDTIFSDVAGSMKLDIPFSDYNQQQGYRVQFDDAALLDLTDQVLRVRVRRESGFNMDPAAPGGIQLSVHSGTDWAGYASSWTNLETTGDWVEASLDLSAASGVDDSEVKAITVVLNTGSGPQ